MTIVAIVRGVAALAAVVLGLSLTACAGPGRPVAVAPTLDSTAASIQPTSAPSSTPANPADPHVPKVIRTGSATNPPIEAEASSTDRPVTYSDGVTVTITDATFAKETSKGPGSFAGRDYVRLTLTISNGSGDPIDLSTTVVTLLDKSGTAIAHVYANEAKVQDFSGTLKPSQAATAHYAFALPAKGRSAVTVVVDFDAKHASAVFRGGLD